jgi:tRNA1Val (adenine37-N6)-methyltransferase
VGADLRKPEELPAPGSFDLAVCNPPYFPPDSGALSPQASRRAARAELTCSLDQVCAAAARLVRWGGRFAVVYRPERLTDLLNTMRQRGLEPKRLRFVQRTASSAPSLLLAEGRRGGGPGLRTEAPLLLEGPDGRPSAELDAIYWKGPVTTL